MIRKLMLQDLSPEDLLIVDPRCDPIQREAIHAALFALPMRDRYVIVRRYLSADEPSMRQIGIELGLSKERVRQLESNGLRLLSSLVEFRRIMA